MASETTGPSRLSLRLRRLWDEQRDVIIIYAILLGIALLAFIALPTFRSPRNFFNVLRQSVALGIVSVGQTVMILVGGIDLSVGGVIGLVDVYAAGYMETHTALPQVLGMVVALLGLGLFVGFINANVVTRLRVAPFIATLGMGAILQGFILLYAKRPGGDIAPGWEYFAEGMIGPVPFPVIFLAILVAITWLLLSRTVWGRHVKATGGSELIARLSGIRTHRVTVYAYMFCSFMAAMTGLYLTSRMGAGDPQVGGLQFERFDLDSITAVLIGGTRLGGGRGGVAGTIAGVLIVSVLNNIFNLVGVNPYIQWIIKGLILLGAVAIYSARQPSGGR
ncbi:MAG TPA: ABC transporter permease [Anaerolineales bacterium]|nr:ABC transporter permease [Anaerolineales bacterium]